MIRNLYTYLVLLIQLSGTKIDIVLFLSSLMLRKLDSLQKRHSLCNKIFVCILNISSSFLSQAFSTCDKGKLVFVRYYN